MLGSILGTKSRPTIPRLKRKRAMLVGQREAVLDASHVTQPPIFGRGGSSKSTSVVRDATQTTFSATGKLRRSAAQIAAESQPRGTHIADHLQPVPQASVFRNPRVHVDRETHRFVGRDAGAAEGYSHIDVVPEVGLLVPCMWVVSPVDAKFHCRAVACT